MTVFVIYNDICINVLFQARAHIHTYVRTYVRTYIEPVYVAVL